MGVICRLQQLKYHGLCLQKEQIPSEKVLQKYVGKLNIYSVIEVSDLSRKDRLDSIYNLTRCLCLKYTVEKTGKCCLSTWQIK